MPPKAKQAPPPPPKEAFSPAPWKYNGKPVRSIWSADGTPLCELVDGTARGEADARLVSSAPQLLKLARLFAQSVLEGYKAPQTVSVDEVLAIMREADVAFKL